LELTPTATQSLIDHCPEDLASGPYIQSSEAMMAEDFAKMNAYMFNMLNRIVHKTY
jgi:hypothetical protein